jgi:hypothetical protein
LIGLPDIPKTFISIFFHLAWFVAALLFYETKRLIGEKLSALSDTHSQDKRLEETTPAQWVELFLSCATILPNTFARDIALCFYNLIVMYGKMAFYVKEE